MLGDVAERFRCRSDSVQGHVKDYGNELASEYDTTYNGGHVAGARSGGPSEEINTVTMLGGGQPVPGRQSAGVVQDVRGGYCC